MLLWGPKPRTIRITAATSQDSGFSHPTGGVCTIQGCRCWKEQEAAPQVGSKEVLRKWYRFPFSAVLVYFVLPTQHSCLLFMVLAL